MPPLQTEVIVIGAGAAGLFAALTAAMEGGRVVLVSATPLAESSTYWAQGGLAAALADGDSPARHLEDTLRAGRGMVRLSAARCFARRRPRPCSASSTSESALMPTAAGISPWDSRAGTRRVASCTPAARRQGGG